MKFPWAKPFLNKQDISHMNKAANSQWVAKGPYVEKFEEKCNNK